MDQMISESFKGLPIISFLRQGDADATVLYLSEGCLLLTGFNARELLETSSYNSLIYPEDLKQLLATIAIAIQQQEPYQITYRIRTKTGEERWLSERGQLSTNSDHPNHLVGLIIDVTETRKVEEQLRLDALHDQLTGLPNRGLFMDRLTQAVRRHQRYPQSLFAVLFLDLDRFKVVNDSLGHLVGDQLLQQVARRLQTCLRPMDTIARLGGDEFTILLEDVQHQNDVLVVADRILEVLSEPFRLQQHEVYSSASVGIAFSTAEEQTPDSLLRDADIALYRAKGAGKARYAIFDPQMRIPALNLLWMETDLRRALERNEFELYYQPIFILETGNIVGFEALLRWVHPERGILLPGEFITIAEETGMLLALDEWALQQACQQLKRWSEQFPDFAFLTISVNLSDQQFAQPDAAERIQQILDQTGLSGDRLHLEINERVIIRNTESVALKLRHLQAIGVQIGLDDFGTGYSSLSYLNQFPVNQLKVDRAFIKAVHTPKNLAIVHTIIDLAHNLGIKVVAEGVETGAQLAQIKAFDCEYGQGYWFAKPLTAHETANLIESQRFNQMAMQNENILIPKLKILKQSGYFYIPLVEKNAWKIGRTADKDIALLDDRWVSKNHAVIQTVGFDDFYLVDLSSRNGSYVNGQRLQAPALLQTGDQLRIGQTVMEFLAEPDSPMSVLDTSDSSVDKTDAFVSAIPQGIKTVFMIYPPNTQGRIWRDALISQRIHVIWPGEITYFNNQDSRWIATHQIPPDLLLIDLQIPGLNPYPLVQSYRHRYPGLPVVFTDSLRSQIDPLNRSWILRQGITDVLPRFQEEEQSPFRLEDVAEQLTLILQYLQTTSLNREALDAAMMTLQQILRQETLS